MKCKKGFKKVKGKCKKSSKALSSSNRKKRNKLFLPISILIVFALTLLYNYFALGSLNCNTIVLPFLEIIAFMSISFLIIDFLRDKKKSERIFQISLVYGALTTIFSLIPIWNNLNTGIVLSIIIFRFISPLIGLLLSRWIIEYFYN